nr:hypothetical protein [Streptomyces sp. NEAU-YJ-81]
MPKSSLSPVNQSMASQVGSESCEALTHLMEGMTSDRTRKAITSLRSRGGLAFWLR